MQSCVTPAMTVTPMSEQPEMISDAGRAGSELQLLLASPLSHQMNDSMRKKLRIEALTENMWVRLAIYR